MKKNVIRFNTLLVRSELNEVHITNLLEYACLSLDDCDKKFVVDHFDWILGVTYTNLRDACVVFLLDDTDQPGMD